MGYLCSSHFGVGDAQHFLINVLCVANKINDLQLKTVTMSRNVVFEKFSWLNSSVISSA